MGIKVADDILENFLGILPAAYVFRLLLIKTRMELENTRF